MISVLTVSVRPERLELVEKALSAQTVSYEWVVEDYSEKPEGFAWAFNRAMNKGIERCKNDLIVSIQDSIWFKPDALAKFEFHFKNNPKACVSGVGDQYDQIVDGKPSHVVWLDPRRTTNHGSFYECNPEDWEINFASLPKALIYEIGGFDEELDRWFGMDNVAVAYRLDRIGAKFFLDQTNESFTFRHDRNPQWDEAHWMQHGFWDWFKDRPVKLDYLS